MGSRGPQKKPKPPLAVAGSIQPARDFDAAPPAHLKRDGREAWVATVDVLREMNLLHIADRHALEAYCVMHDRKAEYDATLAADGQFYVGPNGAICEHPALKRRDKAEMAIERFQKQYGMTAVSRAGLNIGGTKAKPALAARKRG
jgi:P27 family predicted phage terminase small subunit